MEKWKDIDGYEGLYQVSNFGRVRSLDKVVYFKDGRRKFMKGKVLKFKRTKNGYLQIHLYKDNSYKAFYIHRLVAQAFVDNPDNLPEINHKSEDKTDNRVCNLEYCTHLYNMRYGNGQEKRRLKMINGKCAKAVLQYDLEGNFIREWKSAQEVRRELGFNSGSIGNCCRKLPRYYTAYGYIWRYKEERAA